MRPVVERIAFQAEHPQRRQHRVEALQAHRIGRRESIGVIEDHLHLETVGLRRVGRDVDHAQALPGRAAVGFAGRGRTLVDRGDDTRRPDEHAVAVRQVERFALVVDTADGAACRDRSGTFRNQRRIHAIGAELRQRGRAAAAELGARGEVAVQQCGLVTDLSGTQLGRRDRLVGEIGEEQQVVTGVVVGQAENRRIDAHHGHRRIRRRRSPHAGGEKLLCIDRQQAERCGPALQIGDERRERVVVQERIGRARTGIGLDPRGDVGHRRAVGGVDELELAGIAAEHEAAVATRELAGTTAELDRGVVDIDHRTGQADGAARATATRTTLGARAAGATGATARAVAADTAGITRYDDRLASQAQEPADRERAGLSGLPRGSRAAAEPVFAARARRTRFGWRAIATACRQFRAGDRDATERNDLERPTACAANATEAASTASAAKAAKAAGTTRATRAAAGAEDPGVAATTTTTTTTAGAGPATTATGAATTTATADATREEVARQRVVAADPVEPASAARSRAAGCGGGIPARAAARRTASATAGARAWGTTETEPAREIGRPETATAAATARIGETGTAGATGLTGLANIAPGAVATAGACSACARRPEK